MTRGYFRPTNLFIPDPFYWVDDVILSAIIGAGFFFLSLPL